MPAISSFETSHVSRISRRVVPSRSTILHSDSSVCTRSPQVRSARTSGKIPSLLPTEPDILLASADGNPALALLPLSTDAIVPADRS